MKTKNTGSMKICNKNVRNITTWQIDNIKEGYIIGEND